MVTEINRNLLLEKLPKFEYLIQRDHQMRKERVTVHTIPGLGSDIDKKELRS